MAKLEVFAEQFKKMADPTNVKSKQIRYVFYAKANSVPEEFDDWMATNPRERKMTTNVAKTISKSLEDNSNFHDLNRGILISAKDVSYDNQTKTVTIELDDPTIHGNIDGGHTLCAILNAKRKGDLRNERYVFFEVIVGLGSPVELAAARNTSVQVDLKSIEELEGSFSVLKDVFANLPFSHRIAYKQNEHYNDSNIEPIDVREIIAILNMFNQVLYPISVASGKLTDVHPIQSYTGKEASLRRFLDLNSSSNPKRREEILKMMRNILPDIFELWDLIECDFAGASSQAQKRYGTRKYSKYDSGKEVGKSLFEGKNLIYIVPKGILYPLIGAFRALVLIDDNDMYYWKVEPKKAWNDIGSQLTSIILDERADSPDVIAKNSNLWSNLFKEVYIYGHMSNLHI